MILIGVKSKYGSCNGNCTGCIIIIYYVENFSTKSFMVKLCWFDSGEDDSDIIKLPRSTLEE